jgi:hypothetical protein
MGLTIDMIVMFVNRISEELAQNDLKAFEIMKIGDYFVSDIVDRNRFTFIPGQKIIRASSSNIKKILQDIFGHDNIQNPMIDLIDMLMQRIINNNITLFRAYANGYHWIKNNYYDNESRNIGYYSPLQSELANNFKASVIEWLNDANKVGNITEEMIDGMGIRISAKDPVGEFINKLSNEVGTTTDGITEFIVLSKINNDIPIIIRNDTNKIIHFFNDGNHYANPTTSVMSKVDPIKCINIKYEYIGNSTIPDIVDVIYYKDKEI